MKRELPIVSSFSYFRQPGRWKFVLSSEAWFTIPNKNFEAFDLRDENYTLWVKLRGNKIGIRPGYAWDGCSCVPDFESTIAASLFHDATGQFRHLPCLRKNLGWWKWNKIFADIISAQGSPVIAATYLTGLTLFNPLYQFAGKLFGNKPTGTCTPA